MGQKPRQLKGYRVFGGRIAAPSDDWFKKDPVRLIEIFQLAEAEELEIHPETMRQADRDSGLIDNAIREDKRANALFLDLLCGRNDPEMVLRWMNEAGVFGRSCPISARSMRRCSSTCTTIIRWTSTPSARSACSTRSRRANWPTTTRAPRG